MRHGFGSRNVINWGTGGGVKSGRVSKKKAPVPKVKEEIVDEYESGDVDVDYGSAELNGMAFEVMDDVEDLLGEA
jgi:hypothetical protein